MKKSLITTLLLLFSLGAFAAKEGYKITFVAKGNTDSVLYMGYYYAQYKFFCDTAVNNGKGKFVFEDKKDLAPGLYYITNNKDRFIEFVVYREKQFYTLSTDNDNWRLGMTAKGSQENEVYFNFNRANDVFYQEIETAKKTMDSAEFQLVYFPAQRLKLDSMRLDFINRYPDYMFARMMLSTKDSDVPRYHPDGTAMSDRERFEWLMVHFFDNMPLDDEFIIRTPKEVFYNRVMEYVEKRMKNMPPDMICPLLDSLIDRAEPAPSVYRWLILNLTNYFLQSHVMVYDEVYCHLVLRYLATGKVQGLTPSVVDEQIERATKWERLLVGKVAPELILFDTARRAASLHHMPGRYTLLLFWSPTCGHCRDIIPAVYKVYEKYADSLDVSAFAILTEPDDQTVVKWKKFLADHQMTDPRWVNLSGGEANVDWREVYDVTTTPQIYLIDNHDHKFVAKKLSADILETIFKALLNN
ncbi:MAG: DUF5106 domain-containing protein [Bacteroidales bacterium]|nr:DUF5106 domain-containing protein [Bacteroidales bacterium]